jgi:hypothetical protein
MSLSKKQLKAVGRALAAGSMTAEQRADLDALLILADQASAFRRGHCAGRVGRQLAGRQVCR